MSAVLNHLGATTSLWSKPVPWTRVDRRRVAKPALVAAFVAVAPAQLADLTSAIDMRDLTIARACAMDLSASLNAVGARGLCKLLEALRADIAAQDWIVVDTRIAAVRSYLAAVLSTLAARTT